MRGRVLVTGGTGQLGAYVLRALPPELAWGAAGPSHPGAGLAGQRLVPLRIEDPAGVRRVFDEIRPERVIHTAALSRVADCLADPARARQVNAEAPVAMAKLARERGIRFVHVSTDLVFDGDHAPYQEHDETAPR